MSEAGPDYTQPTTDRTATGEATNAEETISSTGTATTSTEAEHTENLNNRRGVTKARELLDQRAAEVAATLPENPSEGDMALIYEGLYVDGFDPLEEGKKVGIMGEITIAADDDKTFTIKALTKQSGEPGDRTYLCDVVYDGTTEGQEEIPGHLLAEAHRANYADAIAGKFTSQTQRELISQYAKDPKFTPTDELLTKVDESLNPINETNRRIAEGFIPYMQKQLDSFKNITESDPWYEVKIQAEELLMQLDGVKNVNSDLLGAHLRDSTLSRLQEYMKQYGDPNLDRLTEQTLLDTRDGLQAEIIKENSALEDYAAGLPEEKKRQLLEMARDPQRIGELLNDEDFLQLPDVLKNAFGENVTLAQAQAITNSFIDNTSNLTAEQRKTLKDKAMTVGKVRTHNASCRGACSRSRCCCTDFRASCRNLWQRLLDSKNLDKIFSNSSVRTLYGVPFQSKNL